MYIALMETIESHFSYQVYDSLQDLSEEDATLLREARKATVLSYAPYSRFRVAAFARLTNGHTVRGFNSENASFPAGLCAERVLLSAAETLYPGVPISTVAISYHNENGADNQPITPCGICRQSLLEYSQRFEQPIRLLLGGMTGKVYVIPSASALLPLAFTQDNLHS